MEITFQLL
ncbi:hypothetical protein LINPERHAP1_LOCUS31298 [Linum perenne]